MNKLKLVVEGETKVVITRQFAAPPKVVYLAHVTPDIVQQWCTGPDGWTMPVCECDLRPGGALRWGWEHPEQGAFHLTGEYIALEPYSRVEHVERMFLPDPTPDNHIVTTFESDGEGTLMTMTMTLPNAEAREAMLATGMADGMEYGYQRLEKLAA